ncbi:MAG TPA: hypothetical protein VE631_09020, partial [Alphaproteobacteria bacterium]|nr:hypothetical protein [Alphaproteobacteria bacterium]
MRASSLRLRLVLAAALWCVGGLALGGYVLSTLFEDSVQRGFDDRLTAQLDALIAGAEIGADGRLHLVRPLSDARFESPYGGRYWQIDRPNGPPERSRSLWDWTLTAPGEAGGTLDLRAAAGPDGQRLRVAARALIFPDGRRYRFQLAADTAEIADEVRRFNRLLFWSLGAIGLGLVLGVVLQVQIGLSPLRAIRRGLARVRAG